MTPVDFLASHRHYVDHLAPVWEAMPPAARGEFFVAGGAAARRAVELRVRARPVAARRRPGGRLVVLASWRDVRWAGPAGFVMVEHGAGQSYGGEPPPDSTPADCSCGLRLLLSPSELCAARNRLHHPHARSVAVGPPRLDRWAGTLPAPGERPTVAFAWHWDSPLCPETRTAWPHWRGAVEALARRNPGWRLLGHGHPKAWPRLRSWYARAGVEEAPSSDRVFAEADVLVADNTSLIYEFAALDRPVVLLDAPWYRRDVEHGMRFWSHADMGVRAGSGGVGELVEAVEVSLAGDPCGARRVEVVAEVFGALDGGAAARAASEIRYCA